MVDVSRHQSYVACVNLLLLLSALLSAMTGVGTGTHARPAAAVVQQVGSLSESKTGTGVARRPVAALPALAGTASPPVATAVRPLASVPLYIARLRV